MSDEAARAPRDWAAEMRITNNPTRLFVDRMEACMRAAEAAAFDLKEVIAEATEAEISKRDIEAMKKIAKMRLKDQRDRAREQLEALSRVGKAVDFDLFDWADK